MHHIVNTINFLKSRGESFDTVKQDRTFEVSGHSNKDELSATKMVDI